MVSITDDYRSLNAAFHEQRDDWGAQGSKWAKGVKSVARMFEAEDILDYGSGKGTLAQAITEWPVHCYEPAFGHVKPDPADMVVCTHVLEHVEPECLADLLDELRYLTRKALFVCVGTGLSGKILPDGRDSNLIIETPQWWRERLLSRFGNVQPVDHKRIKKGSVRHRGIGTEYLTAICTP